MLEYFLLPADLLPTDGGSSARSDPHLCDSSAFWLLLGQRSVDHIGDECFRVITCIVTVR